MQNILVPIDFSSTSIAALDYAVDIAFRTNSRILLLHVIQNPFLSNYSTDIHSYSETSEKDKEKIIKSLKSEASANLNSISEDALLKVTSIKNFVVLNNSVYSGILKFAEKFNPDFIVMGTHGTRNLKMLFLGTNTERIIRLTEKPVIVVRHKIINYDFKNIVFATDLEPGSVKVFSKAWKFIRHYNAKFHILRINTKENSIRRSYAIGSMGILANKREGNFEYAILDANTTEEGISKYCDKVKADLLIIGVRRKKGFKRLFTDKVSEAILRTTNQPVLTIDLK